MPKQPTFSSVKDDYYCYVGRLSEEKGVDTLLDAASSFPFKLKIIGGGPLLESYQKKYSDPKIEFLGQLSPDELFPIVQKARLITLPSVWYENNPLCIIEALCMGTPVCGANIGGIPELIASGKNGYFFRPGDKRDLMTAMTLCFENLASPEIYQRILTDAQNKFGAETFYHKLINIYESKANYGNRRKGS
jgi:glycosyltransferase involved in cell wall biosynthesis